LIEITNFPFLIIELAAFQAGHALHVHTTCQSCQL
jgi:hypothetical protein